jgi:tetratricopeptide (TPR) repeat protein
MNAHLRLAISAGLLLGAGLLSPLPALAQQNPPGSGGLNLQNPYATPNTPGTTGSKVNEPITSRNVEYGKAVGLMQTGEFDDAMLILNKLVAMNPADADALAQLGYCYQRQGDAGKAMGFYKKAIGIKPQNLAANRYAGELLLQMKNLEGAEERLMVLQQACTGCDEYNQLKAKIESYKLAVQG